MSVNNTSVGSDWLTSDWLTTNWLSYYNICNVPTQITMIANGISTTGFQMRWVTYNTTNLRVLWEIGSDGITTSNYTASSNASTDKAVQNVTSDILEKYWESTSNFEEWVQFDVGTNRAISVDTLGILNHNFTTSVSLVLKAYGTSTDPAPVSWESIAPYATISAGSNPNDNRILWVSPSLPLSTYRHWRLEISDPTNPSPYLRIGRIVAGQSLILNGENLIDNLRYGKTNFKEEIPLNGFSSVFNNRTLKRKLDITFNNLNIQAYANHDLLNTYMDYARDVFKSLVIVDPQSPYKYSVYAKLTQMPSEDINYVDSTNEYSSYSLSFDEAK